MSVNDRVRRAISDDCNLVMSCGSFDANRHLLALVILLIFATRHGVRSQRELLLCSE